MTVFLNTLRRIFKSKLQLLLIIILPPIMMLPIGIIMVSDSSALKVGIYDNDRTPYTSNVYSLLSGKTELSKIQSGGGKEAVTNRKVDFAIEIPKGFTDSLLKGEPLRIKTYNRDNAVSHIAVQQFIQSFIEESAEIAFTSKGDKTAFYTAIDDFSKGSFGIDEKKTAGMGPKASYATIGLYVMFMMMTTLVYTTIILANKENRTFQRTLTAPVSLRSYMLQMIAAFLVISYLQVIIVLLILRFIVGAYFGISMLNLFIIFIAASVMCVSFGVAVSSISKSVMQACFVGLGVTFPMTFLGGCWWENSSSPYIMNVIGKFTPVYWFMNSVSKLISNKSITDTGFDILLVMLFSVAFFLFGTWKKPDMAI